MTSTDYVFQEGGCPALSNYARLDEFQREHRPYARVDEAQGYWVITDHAAIREGLQHPELFSSSAAVPVDPDPPYKWIPMMQDPPEHTQWRKLLGAYFSPKRVESLEAEQRAFAADLIEQIRAKGSSEFYADFAAVFPTSIFLGLMGMPTERLDDFMKWEDAILHSTPESDPDRSLAFGAMLEVMEYFQEVIDERRQNAESRGDDIVSHAIGWEVDGVPAHDQDILSCLLLLFMAGLDTVAAQLSYTFHHLATHPDDRRRLVDDPTRIPLAIEELLRAYPIVATGRKATQDMEFHGCPIKAGDMVAFPLMLAGRDPQEHPRGGEVDLDVEGPVRHISFGAGPHRCLGSHLARQELRVALEEWLARIPDFELGDASAVTEHTGGVYSLDVLPLRWATG